MFATSLFSCSIPCSLIGSFGSHSFVSGGIGVSSISLEHTVVTPTPAALINFNAWSQFFGAPFSTGLDHVKSGVL